jgi:NAD(P)H-quinone oxidoreductase subunit 5
MLLKLLVCVNSKKYFMVSLVSRFFSHPDPLSLIMSAFIAYIGLCVARFCVRALQGDHQYPLFFIYLSLLVITSVTMVNADHLSILLMSSCMSHLLVVRLMIHPPSWKAAKAAGMLAGKIYLTSLIVTASAFVLLYLTNEPVTLTALIDQGAPSLPVLIALGLILIATMMQLGVWPFHTWLVSSLNAPTPVLALVHAGITSGGGFLLIRLAPVYLRSPFLLHALFVIGLSSALLGTFWKLMQNDAKRMLACSTMAHMGWILIQCGLGLFPLAVSHIVWHGMSKSYLFLASSSAAQEKRALLTASPTPVALVSALVCGIVGAFTFSYASGLPLFSRDTTLVMMVMICLSAGQMILPLLQLNTKLGFLWGSLMTCTAGLAYGSIFYFFLWATKPLSIMQPQPLTILYIIGLLALILTWLLILLWHTHSNTIKDNPLMLNAYVTAMNASQPHPTTVTLHRPYYKYK